MSHLLVIRHLAICALGLLSALGSAPSEAAIASWFGWGYSENETYKEVREWVSDTGTVLGLVGLIAPPAASAGAVIRTTLVIADVIDPPSSSFVDILSGRFTLQFDPSMRVVAAGWYGEFGADPTLPAPRTDLSDVDISLLQYQANAAMVRSSIVIDQAAGLAEFEFDWGPEGFQPTAYMDSEGHFNIAGLFLEAPSLRIADAVTVVGSAADTIARGTGSSTYMLCSTGYCGVTPVPEPESWALMLASLGVVAWGIRRPSARLAEG